MNGEYEGREDGEDQEVSANGTAGTITATVQPCACVCVFSVTRRTLNLTGQSP